MLIVYNPRCSLFLPLVVSVVDTMLREYRLHGILHSRRIGRHAGCSIVQRRLLRTLSNSQYSPSLLARSDLVLVARLDEFALFRSGRLTGRRFRYAMDALPFPVEVH